jgi:hypothetical protein
MKKTENPYLPEGFSPADLPAGGDEVLGRPGCLTAQGVTALFLILTLVFLGYFGLLLVNPYVPVNPFPPRTPLPVYVVATANPNPPTLTPVPTKIPDLPQLSTLVPTDTATPLEQPSVTASATPAVIVTLPGFPTGTIIVPSPTLVSGGTPVQVVEGVFTPPPPGNAAEYTRAPFPFTVYEDAASYMQNPNTSGCRWASIAGAVTNLDGVPLAGLAVRVIGEGIDEIRFTGTALTYGPSGYEIFLNGAPLRGQYIVQLLSQTGSPISAPFTVETSAVCEENVSIVNFVQNYAY